MDADGVREARPGAMRSARRLVFLGAAWLAIVLALLVLPSVIERASAADPCAVGGISLRQGQNCTCDCGGGACFPPAPCGIDEDGRSCSCSCAGAEQPPNYTPPPTQRPTNPPGGGTPGSGTPGSGGWVPTAAPPTVPPWEDPGGGNLTPTPGTPPTQEPVIAECFPWGLCASGWARMEWTYDPPFMYPVQWTCMAAELCEWDDPPDPPEPPPPCIPNPPDVICDATQWGYYIWVEARVPPHRVQVIPFPRWLVAMGAPLPAPYESGEPGRLILV